MDSTATHYLLPTTYCLLLTPSQLTTHCLLLTYSQLTTHYSLAPQLTTHLLPNSEQPLPFLQKPLLDGGFVKYACKKTTEIALCSAPRAVYLALREGGDDTVAHDVSGEVAAEVSKSVHRNYG